MDTKGIITDAAFSLFREFPFESITVQMILDRAKVSRKTFYRYFPDKYVLMENYYRNFMDTKILEEYDGHNWESILQSLYDFVKAEKSYFIHVTSGQDSFWEFLKDYSNRFYTSVKLKNEGRNKLSENERLTVMMITEGQMAAFRELVRGNTDITGSQFARLLVSFFPSSYFELKEDGKQV